MSDERKFIARWSQLKQEARETPDTPAPNEPEPPAEAPNIPPEEMDTLSDAELCERLDLPDPDTLQEGDDYTVFLQDRVPERLKRVALRRLWRSNPIFGHLDGLNEYDEDMSIGATAVEQVQTLYKVGQGYARQEPSDAPDGATTEAAEDAIPNEAEKNIAVQDTCAPSPDSATAGNQGDDAGEEGPHSEIARAVPDSGEERRSAAKSRRMAFRFVEKSNRDDR